VPNPQPLPHTSNAISNPLSTISNEAPALVNDDVSPKPPVGAKKQRLTLCDTHEVMVSFATANHQSEFAFQDDMRSRIESKKEKAAIKK
jgi:hypothetical protein